MTSRSFYPKHSPIGGHLRDNWFASTDYKNLKTNYREGAFTLSNLFPIWKFSDEDSFHVWLTELFGRRCDLDGSNSIFPEISDPNTLLELDLNSTID